MGYTEYAEYGYRDAAANIGYIDALAPRNIVSHCDSKITLCRQVNGFWLHSVRQTGFSFLRSSVLKYSPIMFQPLSYVARLPSYTCKKKKYLVAAAGSYPASHLWPSTYTFPLLMLLLCMGMTDKHQTASIDLKKKMMVSSSCRVWTHNTPVQSTIRLAGMTKQHCGEQGGTQISKSKA